MATEDGKVHECRAAGRFRKDKIKPLIGDRVLIEPQTATATGSVREILPRTNTLTRPKAANVDILLIVVCPKEPNPDLGLVDKLILQARLQNVEPILCVNKADLDPQGTQAIRDSYAGVCKTVGISALNGSGMDELWALLENKTTCLAGQSAVGKSTLINQLCELSRETGGLSAKTERGKHTTRSVELFRSERANGYVLDTPGFSVFGAAAVEPAEIGKSYADFEPYIEQCAYPSCLHRDEPDCAVKNAVEEGKIDRGRYERYLNLLKEREEISKWQ